MSLLFLEAVLVERLRERLPAGVHVLTAPALDAPKLAPAVYLLYSGASVVESRADGRACRVRQRWLAVINVRHAGRLSEGDLARADAGELADAVLEALMGWQPEGTSQPLTPIEFPDPVYLAGHQTLPLVFSTEFVRSNRA